MYNYLLSYVLSSTNYKIQNTNNIYNFIISIITKDNKEEIIKQIKINIGLSFYNEFKIYYYNKLNISLD